MGERRGGWVSEARAVFGAIIAVPIAAAIEIVLGEATAGRRARIAAAEGRQ